MILRFIFFFLTVITIQTADSDVAVNEVHLNAASSSVSSDVLVADTERTSLLTTGLSNSNSTCEGSSSLTDHFDKDSYSEASYNDVRPPAPKTPKREEDFGDDFGVPQTIDLPRQQECNDKIRETREYIENEVMVDEKYKKIRSICKNKHESCTFWSILGECEKNPGYMTVNCAPSCGSCEMLHVETRCPIDPNAVDAFYPGDVNKLFEKIISAPEYQRYDIEVVSRPPEGPWIVILDNAISDEEAQRLIDLGGQLGYERSADVGEERDDGTYTLKVYNGRTSTNAWCVDDCYKDPIAQRVMKRIENITGIPDTNSENLQLLRYEHTQYYQEHSDYINYQIDRPTGVRILTFYMYLNDVEEGGGTNFPKLNLTVKPKRGRAVLWPSVLDSNPNQKDSRTNHQALPVIKGVKYGANAWIHQRDFKTPNKKGC